MIRDINCNKFTLCWLVLVISVATKSLNKSYEKSGTHTDLHKKGRLEYMVQQLDVLKNGCSKYSREAILFQKIFLVGIWLHFTIVTFQSFSDFRETWFLGKSFKTGIYWLLTELKRPLWKISTISNVKLVCRCFLRTWVFWNRFKELLLSYFHIDK